MQFAGRWRVSIPMRVREDHFQAWARAHPNGWVIISIQKNTTRAYAVMEQGCFEQSYSHLHRVLRVCPVSMFFMMPQDKINIA